MSATKLMPVTLLNWKPMRRNSLLGFAEIRLGAMIINDVTINNSSGRLWAGLPSKPMIDRDGNAMRNEQGKIKYVPLVQWASKESGDRFSESVIAALDEKFPAFRGE